MRRKASTKTENAELLTAVEAHFEVLIANTPFYILLAVEASSEDAAETMVRDWLVTDGSGLAEADARNAGGDPADPSMAYRVHRVRERNAIDCMDRIGPFGMIGSGGNG